MLTQMVIKADSPPADMIAGASRSKAGSKTGKAFSSLLASITNRKTQTNDNPAAELAADGTARASRTALRPGAQLQNAAPLDRKKSGEPVLPAVPVAPKSEVAAKALASTAEAATLVADTESNGRGKKKTNAVLDGREAVLSASAQPANRLDKTESKLRQNSVSIQSDMEANAKPMKVHVTDMRLKAKQQAPLDRKDAESSRSEPGLQSAQSDTKPMPNALPDHGFTAESVADTQPTAEAQTQPGGQASGLASGLAARLREDGASDIVRAAQVVLREGELGIIRMRLEPQSLGGVKIELKLAEKLVSGRIVVESDLAAEAFRSSLDALRDAFAEAGFETASLEVEVRGQGQGGERADGRETKEPYFSAGLRELGKAVPELVQGQSQGFGLGESPKRLNLIV